jgi:AraC family transcriptional regulator
MFASGFVLERIDHPKGAVTVEAGREAVLAVRINLLARGPATGARDGGQLKQCIAPDFMVVAAPGRRVTLPAHAAQAVLVLRLVGEPFKVVTGAELGAIAAALHGKVLADGLVTGLVERLADVAGRDPRLADSLLQTLCLALVERVGASANREHPRGGLTERQLSVLRRHVEGHLDQPLPIAALAALVGLSAFHFARAFKASMGIAPAAWIRLRRLTVAQRLLQDATRSVSDVAAAVGYDSPSRFSRAFRALTGKTPSQFRRASASLSVGSDPPS